MQTPAKQGAIGLRGLWVFVGLTLLGLAGASLAVIAGLGQGPTPPFVRGRSAARPATPPAPDPDALHLAGSGTNLPLTRRLAAAFRAQHPQARLVVHESIGSAGGVRATADGAVSLGLVSRPLKPAERRLGLRRVPYARVAVVVATHGGVGEVTLTGPALIALYKGERERWPGGARVHVIQRERGDSAHVAVARALPAFGAEDDRARDARRWRVVYSDAAMREALLATPGSVGLFDLGAIVAQKLPLRVQPYEGRRPTRADPLPAGYPFHKDLAFVVAPNPDPRVTTFLRFVVSAQGSGVIRQSGYLPRSGTPP